MSQNVTLHLSKCAHGLPLSDRPGGGIGTRSVAEMVEKHGDMVRFQQIDGIFTVQLMIHL